MKAILVRYLGPTNHKGARWVATAEGGHRIVRSREYGDNAAEDASSVAITLCQTLGWKGDLVSGTLPNGNFVFCFAQSNTPLRHAAARLLEKLDNMTTEDFANGAEREERERVRTLAAGA